MSPPIPFGPPPERAPLPGVHALLRPFEPPPADRTKGGGFAVGPAAADAAPFDPKATPSQTHTLTSRAYLPQFRNFTQPDEQFGSDFDRLVAIPLRDKSALKIDPATWYFTEPVPPPKPVPGRIASGRPAMLIVPPQVPSKTGTAFFSLEDLPSGTRIDSLEMRASMQLPPATNEFERVVTVSVMRAPASPATETHRPIAQVKLSMQDVAALSPSAQAGAKAQDLHVPRSKSTVFKADGEHIIDQSKFAYYLQVSITNKYPDTVYRFQTDLSAPNHDVPGAFDVATGQYVLLLKNVSTAPSSLPNTTSKATEIAPGSYFFVDPAGDPAKPTFFHGRRYEASVPAQFGGALGAGFLSARLWYWSPL